MNIKLILTLTVMLGATSGCAVIDSLRPSAGAGPAAGPAAAPAAAPAGPGAGPGAAAAASPEALDTTSAAEKQAALSAPAASGERELGKAAVSLGSPAEPGIWLRSALVTAPGKGRVVTAGGTSVAVDLLPGAGAAQLSLAAYRALGLSLTDLPEVTVFAN